MARSAVEISWTADNVIEVAPPHPDRQISSSLA